MITGITRKVIINDVAIASMVASIAVINVLIGRKGISIMVRVKILVFEC